MPKVLDAIKVLKQDWRIQIRGRGSHRRFQHPNKPGLVTFAGKPSKDLPPKTCQSILKQAGLR